MLVRAMEVSGIEGNFRSTCEGVMSVLRSNKDSVMAMLEAFVHDPLINWRLPNQTAPGGLPTRTRGRGDDGERGARRGETGRGIVGAPTPTQTPGPAGSGSGHSAAGSGSEWDKLLGQQNGGPLTRRAAAPAETKPERRERRRLP